MEYDEFKRRLEAEEKRRFEGFQKGFNEAMRKQGRPETLDSVLGAKPPPPPPAVMPEWEGEKLEQLVELFLDVFKETTDDDPRDIVLRAMATYRSFVKHARAGGQVKFVREGEKDRVLKVRLR